MGMTQKPKLGLELSIEYIEIDRYCKDKELLGLPLHGI